MGGGRRMQTGWRYYGNVAAAICVGPVDALLEVRAGDGVVWEGPLHRSDADEAGRSILATTLGTIHFYWGTLTQQVDPDLAGLQIDFGSGGETVPQSPLRGICYMVGVDMDFGESPLPPNLRFSLRRQPQALAISAHDFAGDASLPEALYELLTNSLYGAGMPAGKIDRASFEAAAETLIEEGIAGSPVFDDAESLRNIAGQIALACGGRVCWDGEAIRFLLERARGAEGLPEITQADLLEEPDITDEGWGNAWAETRLEFRDRDNLDEATVEPYFNPAAAHAIGWIREKRFDLTWLIRSRGVAQRIAARLGAEGGQPAKGYRLALMPDWAHLAPGTRVRFSYAPFNLSGVVLTVLTVTRGGPEEPDVEIEAIEDLASDPAVIYTPQAVPVPPPAALAVPAAEVRLGELPEALREGAVDGLLVAATRSNPLVVGHRVWFTWDPAQADYAIAGEGSSFAAMGRVLFFKPLRETNWMIRLEAAGEADRAILAELAGALGTFAVGPRSGAVMPSWWQRQAGGRWEEVQPGVWDIEVAGAAFGTGEMDFGAAPARDLFIGRREDFRIIPSDAIFFARPQGNHPADIAQVRHIKVAGRNFQREEPLSAAGGAHYDRPGGAFSPDWGPPAAHVYEAFDLSPEAFPDIDNALGAMFAGEQTAEEAFLWADVDAALRAVHDTGSYLA